MKSKNVLSFKRNGIAINVFICNDGKKIREIQLSLVSFLSERRPEKYNDFYENRKHNVSHDILDTVRKISLHLNGEVQNFNTKKIISILDFSKLSNFAIKILLNCQKIKFGKVLSYGELAEISGENKSAARAVGRVMSINPYPIIIPCHRVIAAQRKIGGFQGTKYNVELKKKLLQLEGIKI